MPYARTFGALAMLAFVFWCLTISLLVGVLEGDVPAPLFLFVSIAAGTSTVVASQVWMCSFAAAGRADLTENIRGALRDEAERIGWQSYSEVCEAVLVENDRPDQGGAVSVQ